jgi:renal tumor antigen
MSTTHARPVDYMNVVCIQADHDFSGVVEMQNYRILSKKGEGTFSRVMVGVSVQTHVRYAIKCMKKKFESLEDINKLAEIQALRRLSRHPHIIRLHDVLYEGRRLAVVLELMDMNLYEAIKDRRTFVPEQQIISWMYQLFQALAYMHGNNLFHRDVKPENLLLLGHTLKLGDLGSCSSIGTVGPPFTEYISTRWYRAPECLLTSGFYGSKMDIWAAACVLYEVATLKPLFPGKNELDQRHKIHSILGTPSDHILSQFRSLPGEHLGHISFQPTKGSGFKHHLNHCSTQLVTLLTSTLIYDPVNRPTAHQCLQSPIFSKLEQIQSKSPNVKAVSDLDKHPLLSQSTTCVSPPVSESPRYSQPDVPPLPNIPTITGIDMPKLIRVDKLKARQPVFGKSARDIGLANQRRRSNMVDRNGKITNRRPNLSKFRNFTQIYRIDLQADKKEPLTHR